MRIADICTRDVVQIGPRASVSEAARTMRTRHVGALVVTDQPNGERIPVGILTDRDIVVSVVAADGDARALSVGDAMSRDVATCSENEALFDAVRIMRRRGVRRLPVLNANGALAGIVTADDIYAALSTQMGELSNALSREQIREMTTRT